MLYHATYKQYLKSIYKNGLDNEKSKLNWEDSVRGVVYLAKNKEVAESYAELSEAVPDDYIENIVILEIELSETDLLKLRVDQNVIDNNGDTVEYRGVILANKIKNIENLMLEYNLLDKKRKRKP